MSCANSSSSAKREIAERQNLFNCFLSKLLRIARSRKRLDKKKENLIVKSNQNKNKVKKTK